MIELPSDWIAPGLHRRCACGHLPSWHSGACRAVPCACEGFSELRPEDELRPATDEDWMAWVEAEECGP